ncbi:MAG: NAD(P)H-hydrate dehydratase [Bacillota bacterium]|nr:NAD(P)H-hydrate dehydratase [Bacillota bacterium]
MKQQIDLNLIKSKLRKRDPYAHKGSMGTLLCVCGSYGMAGAAILSIRAGLRSGVGLIKAVLPSSIYPIVSSNVWEAVFLPVEDSKNGRLPSSVADFLIKSSENAGACLIGPGIGLDSETEELVCKTVENFRIPMVIDADGINAVSKHIDVLKKAQAPIVLTPHLGEMARLTCVSISEIERCKSEIAAEFAKKNNVIVVLKGPGTVVASPNGEILINTTGNAGMATGGSGDVLSGMIASFIAQGFSPYDAAACGVYLHGAAGDLAAQTLSQTSMLPSDIIEQLPLLFKNLEL